MGELLTKLIAATGVRKRNKLPRFVIQIVNLYRAHNVTLKLAQDG